VTYDPAKVQYEQLLDIFWENHDPTQENGQGMNLGSQYRSAIFFYSEEQQKAAEFSKASLTVSGRVNRPVTTGIVEAEDFIRAEDYHQQYLEKNPSGYCGIGGTGNIDEPSTERPETIERPERPERIEHFERPDVATDRPEAMDSIIEFSDGLNATPDIDN